jgi:hypothetical protein
LGDDHEFLFLKTFEKKDFRKNKRRAMKHSNKALMVAAVFCASLVSAPVVRAAADLQPATNNQPNSTAPQAASEPGPMVPAATPGVYSQVKRGAGHYRLIIKGHNFTSQDAIEKYVLYRAADLTLQQHFQWFTLTESRSKGDIAPVPKRDLAGLHYSFRMQYWRPVWRYKFVNSPSWTTWSPFSNVAFFAHGKDPKTISDFELSADIVMHKGTMDDNPLAFEADAVSDFLINQVSPPE